MSSKSRFKPQTRRYTLVWEDNHDLAGLQVVMRAMRMGELEKLGSMWEEFGDADDDSDASNRAKMSLLGNMIERVAGVLVSWNRLDEDTMKWNEETEEYEETPETTTLPANAEGLRRLEEWEFMAILDAYMTQAVGVNHDLGKDSNNGAPSLAQLPMTEL